MAENTKCAAVYVPSGKTCERPQGHREDAESVWQDPDGCHEGSGTRWTNFYSKPSDS